MVLAGQIESSLFMLHPYFKLVCCWHKITIFYDGMTGQLWDHICSAIGTCTQVNSWISHDVTAAMLVSPNNEMAAYWCPDPILWELKAIIMLTSSFVFVEKHGC